MRPDENKKRHIVVCGKGGGSEQAQADWNQTDNEQPDYIKNKPTIPAAPVQSDWNEADTSSLAYIANKPTILTQWFGTQAEYDAIAVKDPDTIYNIEGSDNVQADWNQSDSSADDYIKNKPTIPVVPTNVSAFTNDAGYTTFDGDYNSLTNKPTIPAAQVNSDWNAVSGVAQILNKPTIPTVPAMAIETLTFTLQGGTVKTVEFYTVPNYFYVEDVSGSNNTLSITKASEYAPTIEVFKSTDKTNWESMGTTSTTAITATIPANGKLYLKANANALWCGNNERHSMSASGNHNVGGNIMSLIYGDNFEGKTTFPANSYYTHSGFTGLFYQDTHLINASNLVLPITTMIKGAYNMMFQDCSNLLTAPSELPATTLADSCYSGMFRECTSLTTAPVLSATTLAGYCYSSMFNGCTSLNRVTTYASNISASGCLVNWLNNVSATGEFYNLGGATYTSGVSGIPSGWTEYTSL